jgi:phage baseplate assembly protein W
MALIITADGKSKITLTPETLVEEVIQNVTMLLSTIKTTVPLYRDFGLSARFLDKPTPAARAMLVAEIIDAIEIYEPRAEVVNITFAGDEMAGQIIPRLEVEIHE